MVCGNVFNKCVMGICIVYVCLIICYRDIFLKNMGGCENGCLV